MRTAFGLIGALCAGIFGWYVFQAIPEGQGAEPQLVQESTSATEFSREIPVGFKEYRNGMYGFSLLYPEGFAVKEMQESAISHSTLFANKEGTGFQVYVVYYPETKITDAQFTRDVPSGKRTDIQEAMVDGTRAVMFTSSDIQAGDLREVWFIRNSYLYEVTAPAVFADDLMKVMNTWKFIR